MATKKTAAKKSAAAKNAKTAKTTKAAKPASKRAIARVVEGIVKAKSAKADGDKKLSAIDAAAKVLAEQGEPMNAKQMIEAMGTKGYWTSPGGKTPHATLYSAILREIGTKGKEARFKKTDRGQFALSA